MSFWGIILVVFLGFMGLGFYLSYSASLKARTLFRSLDKKYEDFVQKSISSGIIESDSYQLDMQALMADIMLVIKPEIDAILAHINTTDVSDVRIKGGSRFFKNVAQISEELYEKRNKNKDIPVSDQDKARFLEAFKDAVVADLTQRKVDLRLGRL